MKRKRKDKVATATPATVAVPAVPATADQPAVGLECPRCGCRHFEVLRTQPTEDGIRRYRACRHCGRRLVTLERVGGQGEKGEKR